MFKLILDNKKEMSQREKISFEEWWKYLYHLRLKLLTKTFTDKNHHLAEKLGTFFHCLQLYAIFIVIMPCHCDMSTVQKSRDWQASRRWANMTTWLKKLISCLNQQGRCSAWSIDIKKLVKCNPDQGRVSAWFVGLRKSVEHEGLAKKKGSTLLAKFQQPCWLG